MVDVFISYSRTNRDAVVRLAEAVKAEGYSLWWDEELPPHLSYGDVITEKIGSAKAAIVVWSKAAGGSEWVRAEADVARNQKKLIQVSVDEAMPPLPFNQIQFASIADWQGEPDHPGWRKVKASLKALCGERDPAHAVASAPLPPPPPPTPSPRADPPLPAPPAATGGRGMGPIVVLLALLVVVIGTGVFLLWSRGGGEPREVAKQDASVPAPASPGSEAPAPTARTAPAAPRAVVPNSGEDEAVEEIAAGIEEESPILGEVAPNSHRQLLERESLPNLSRLELAVARNEIYARHGYEFRNPILRRHFSQFGWYRPRPGPVRLNAVERANVQMIEEEERAR
jgi:TIR domain/YARHG domain